MSESNKSFESVLKKIWYVFFILLYPVLITFSLIFTGILLVFSGISKILFKIIHLFDSKSDERKINHEVKPTVHPPANT